MFDAVLFCLHLPLVTLWTFWLLHWTSSTVLVYTVNIFSFFYLRITFLCISQTEAGILLKMLYRALSSLLGNKCMSPLLLLSSFYRSLYSLYLSLPLFWSANSCWQRNMLGSLPFLISKLDVWVAISFIGLINFRVHLHNSCMSLMYLAVAVISCPAFLDKEFAIWTSDAHPRHLISHPCFGGSNHTDYSHPYYK